MSDLNDISLSPYTSGNDSSAVTVQKVHLTEVCITHTYNISNVDRNTNKGQED